MTDGFGFQNTGAQSGTVQEVSVSAATDVDITSDSTRELGRVWLAEYTPVGSRLPVTGPLTDFELRYVPVNTYILDPSTGYRPCVEARKQTPTGYALNVQIGPGDIISNLPVTIDFGHHQTHEGEAFMAQYVDTALDTNTVKFGLTTGAGAATTRSPHLSIDCDVYNGSIRFDLYAEATFTGGSTITPVNRNRNIALPAGIMTVKYGVTSTDGTLIESHFIGAGGKQSASGGSRDEWILKPSTIYRLDLIGLATGTDAILHLNWYEDLGV